MVQENPSDSWSDNRALNTLKFGKETDTPGSSYKPANRTSPSEAEVKAEAIVSSISENSGTIT